MASSREMRLRIRSVKNIAQVTRALETVSASYARKAIRAVEESEPYSEKAWKVLVHLARQPGKSSLHPLLKERKAMDKVLVLLVSGDRGLAGAYNVNIVRNTLQYFTDFEVPVAYVTVGKKGQEMLSRRKKDIQAEFSHLPVPASFMDVSAIGRLVVDEYLKDNVDRVYISYTKFESMIHQVPVIRKILPLDVEYKDENGDEDSIRSTHHSNQVFLYEPGQVELLEEIVPRFTALQIYQSILSSQASEQAARMVAMRNATDNAQELISVLQLEYNKVRQQVITGEMLDIVGGVEAMAVSGQS